jgi:protein phosphatase
MKPENKFEWFSRGRTHVGRVREINQDAFANYPEKGLWVVADGMGGHKDGAIASGEVIRVFKQFETEKNIGVAAKKIYQQLDKVNEALIKLATSDDENEVIGTTVVVLYATKQHCVAVWSGDSRLYLFRRGQLKQITRDHNNEYELLAEGFTPEEIKVHPHGQILTHAIGGEENVYLDAQIQEIRHGDIYLLCSDGLNKEIPDSEIEEILTQMPYQKAIEFLMELSLQRGGRDNITIVLAQAVRMNEL